jgi:hypothetical protein
MSVDRFPLFPLGDSPVALLLQDVQKTAAQLAAKVGDGAFALPVQAASTKRSLDLFDQPLAIGATARAEAEIHPKGTAPTAFAGETLQAPTGTAWSELRLAAGVELAGSGSTTAGGFALSAKLATEAALGYRLLLPTPTGETRLGAFLALVGSSRLPGQIRLQRLEPGEVHQYTARLGVSLGLEASTGFSSELKQDIAALTNALGSAFADVSAEVQLRVDASFKASLGLAISDDVAITIGRAGTLRPAEDGWLRVRIERARERRFTAGAVFALQIQYRAADAANAILDRAFGLLPLPRAVESFREVNALLAEGEWDKVKGRLSGRAQSLIAAWLDDTQWRQKTQNSSTIQKLVEASGEVVEAYEELRQGVGGELQSFVDRLLGEAKLVAGSPLRDALAEIEGLQATSLRQRLIDADANLAAAISLLELLSGRSLEELVLASDSGLGNAVTEASGLAHRAIGFLARLEKLPSQVLDRFDALATKSGIGPVVDWLRTNAGSTEQLVGAVDEGLQDAIERVVERLTGKLFEQLSDVEREKIERWAKKVHDLLSTGDLEEKLRAAADKLDGELGFSLAIEVERLTRESSLLDLELDPADGATRKAVSAHLGAGAIGKILESLPQSDADEPPPYRLRECAFVSRRVRSVAISILASLVGGRTTRSQWIRERTIRVTQDGGKLSRSGRWNGGFVRSVIGNEADLFEAGAWLEASATGAGGDLDTAYGKPRIELRLTLQREDRKTTDQELDHYETLLDQLGFQKAAGGPSPPQLAAGTSLDTRLALVLQFPEGLGPFVAGSDQSKLPAGWGDELLDAARRWWDEPLITRPSSDVLIGGKRARLGIVLAALAADKQVRMEILKGSASLVRAYQEEQARVTIGGKPVDVDLVQNNVLRPDYNSVREVSARVRESHRRARELSRRFQAVTTAGAAVPAAALDELSDQAANTFAGASGTLWSNPGLAFWFVLSRLSSSGVAGLTGSRGFATLRWRTGPEEQWEGPARWLLGAKGLGGLRAPGGVFG